MDEAERLYDHALAVCDSIFDEPHPVRSAGLVGLGSLLTDTDRTIEAEPLLRQAHITSQSVLGVTHPETMAVGTTLARVLDRARRRARRRPQILQREPDRADAMLRLRRPGDRSRAGCVVDAAAQGETIRRRRWTTKRRYRRCSLDSTFLSTVGALDAPTTRSTPVELLPAPQASSSSLPTNKVPGIACRLAGERPASPGRVCKRQRGASKGRASRQIRRLVSMAPDLRLHIARRRELDMTRGCRKTHLSRPGIGRCLSTNSSIAGERQV